MCNSCLFYHNRCCLAQYFSDLVISEFMLLQWCPFPAAVTHTPISYMSISEGGDTPIISVALKMKRILRQEMAQALFHREMLLVMMLSVVHL